VFSGDVRACFRSSLDEVRRQGAGFGLRVRLRLTDPELVDLPWEYLYNSSVNRFLALSVQTPLVRYMELAERIQPISVTPPIRVLVMISSPTDFPTLDVEAEWKRLNDSLSDLLASGDIAIDRLDDASLGALQRRLRKSQYHIFHYIGHGEFDNDAQEGVLILEAENERGHRVGSQYLGMLLHDHESLRVAILNACEGARTSRTDPFAGSAQSLVQQGIPAVIAMQFEIADDVASTFAHEFYGALADGYPIDAALTEARKAIFAGGREVEWGTPVLYMRAPDGRIFDVDRTATGTVRRPKTMQRGAPAIQAPRTGEPDREQRERLVLEAIARARNVFNAGQRAEALTILRRFSSTQHVAAEALRQLTLEDKRLTALDLREEQERNLAEQERRQREAAEAQANGARQRLEAAALEAGVRHALDEQTARDEARKLERKLREEVERARALEREAALAREREIVDRHLTAGEIEAAHEALTQADAAYAPGAAFADLRTRLAEMQRQARARHDKTADDVIAQARKDFVQSPAAAVALLEGFAPPHPRVSAVSRELKQLTADGQERAMREAEHRAAEAHDRRRAEEQRERDLQHAVQHIEGYLERHELAEAGAAQAEAEAAFGVTSALEGLRGRLADAERRAAFDSSARAAIAAARREAAHGNHAAAIVTLEKFSPPHQEVDAALEELRDVAEQQDRRRDVHRRIQELIAGAEREPSHSAALASLQEGLALDPDHAGLQQAVKQRRSALRIERAKVAMHAVVHSPSLRRTVAIVALTVSVSALIGLFLVSRWPVWPELPVAWRFARIEPRPAIQVEVKLLPPVEPAPPGPVPPKPVSDQPVGADTPLISDKAAGIEKATGSNKPVSTDPPNGELIRTSGDPEKPSVSPPPPLVDPDLLKYRNQAQSLYAAGNRERALGAVTRGLGIDRTDSTLRTLLDRIISDARKSALNERGAAVERKATTATAFQNGEQSMRRAELLSQKGQGDSSARAYWEAARSFKDAVAAPPPPNSAPPEPIKPRPSPAAPVVPLTTLTSQIEAAIRNKSASDARRLFGELQRSYPLASEIPRLRPAVQRLEDEAAITEAVRAYAEAVTRRDKQAVLRLFPSAPAAELRGLDGPTTGIGSYRMVIEVNRIRITDDMKARVDVTVLRLQTAASGKSGSDPKRMELRYERSGGYWIRTR
jgi:hypothetical protein